MFKKLELSSRVDFVTEQIEAAILEGEFNPGDKLPSLHQMQEMFGTGRSTIREALSILTQKGLVETKQGAGGGTFVKELSSQNVIESLGLLIRKRKISREEILQFRSCFEEEAVGLAVEMAQREEIDQLKELLTKAEEHVKAGLSHWEEFYLVEAQMHVVLARMTHNTFIKTITTVIAENDRYYRSYLPKRNDNVREAFKDWCQIVEALEMRAKRKAMKIARAHLARTIKYLKNYIED